MKNIEYLLAKVDVPKYTTTTEVNNIIKSECDIQGKQKQLARCMEEFSELIEVIVLNNIYGRVNHINLAEEMADCLFCIEVLKTIYELKYSDIPLEYTVTYTGDNILNNCILNLTTATIKISKCIREKDGAELKIIELIASIYETIDNLIEFYKIDKALIDKIYLFKVKRSDERNQKYWETVRNNYDDSSSNYSNTRSTLTAEEAGYNISDIEVVSSDEIEYCSRSN